MKYRLVKKPCWWCELFDGNSNYLFWDNELDRFRVGCRATARKHVWEFSQEDLSKMRADYPDIDEEFYLEECFI